MNPEDPTTTPSDSSVPSLDSALDTFDAALAPLVAAFTPSLLNLAPKDSSRHQRMSPTRAQAVPVIIAMVRAHPEASMFTADDLEALQTDATRCTQLAQRLMTLATLVNNTARLKEETLWQMSSESYTIAEKRAPRDTALNQYVTQISDILAIGPLVETSAQTAVAAKQRADKATARAAKAQQEATEAAERAAAVAAKHAESEGT